VRHVNQAVPGCVSWRYPGPVNPDRKRQQLARRIVERQRAERAAPDDPVMESLDRMRNQVNEIRNRDPDDPHGFHGMSERELVNWMGAENAQPGSVAYQHAELVLSMKQREAERSSKLLDRAGEVRQMFDEPPAPKVDTPTGVTAVHVAVIAFPLTLLGILLGAKVDLPWALAAAAAAFVCLVVGPSQRALARLLDGLARIGS
jgi:hypothetical protein